MESITLEVVNRAKAIIESAGGSRAGVIAMYEYMASLGYNYPKLCLGLVKGESDGGLAAKEYMSNVAVAQGKPIGDSDWNGLYLSFANAYLDKLKSIVSDAGTSISREISAQEAWDFHNKVNDNNGYGHDAWTLNTPFEILDASGDSTLKEKIWAGVLASQGDPTSEMWISVKMLYETIKVEAFANGKELQYVKWLSNAVFDSATISSNTISLVESLQWIGYSKQIACIYDVFISAGSNLQNVSWLKNRLGIKQIWSGVNNDKSITPVAAFNELRNYLGMSSISNEDAADWNKFFAAYVEVQKSPLFTQLAGKVVINSSSSLFENPKADFSSMVMLHTLGSVALKGSGSTQVVLNSLLKDNWNDLYADWASDQEVRSNNTLSSIEKIEKLHFSDQYIDSRSEMLSRLNQYNKYGPILDITDSYHYQDKSTGKSLLIEPTVLGAQGAPHEIYFADDSGGCFDGKGVADSLFGGAGADTLSGNAGDDYIEGGAGDDSLSGGADNDTLLGGQGADELNGGDGNNVLYGGSGDDRLIAGKDQDSMYGGEGYDAYWIKPKTGLKYIKDSDGKGVILLDGVALTGGTKVANNIWMSSDGATTYVLTDLGGGKQDLTIQNGDETIVIADWSREKNLEIQLDDGTSSQFASTPADRTILGDLVDLAAASSAGQSVRYDDLGNPIGPGAANAKDKLFGSDGNDLILAKGGDDSVNAYLGNDTLVGGDGSDVLSGGEGNDLLFAGQQIGMQEAIDQITDQVSSGARGDLLAGGNGENTIVGGAGNDLIFRGDGSRSNLIFGGGGNDIVLSTIDKFMSAGDWTASWTKQNWGSSFHVGGVDVRSQYDSFYTKTKASDTIYGGQGNDDLFGGGGGDYIDGGADNDVILGLWGDDTLLGGDGEDRIGGDGNTQSLNFTGEWNLYISSSGGIIPIGLYGNDLLLGEKGNDTLTGNAGNDTLWGGADNDVLYGDDNAGAVVESDPTLYMGNDFLSGDDGNDELYGGGLSDTLWGGDGNDNLYGDDDSLSAAMLGADRLYGGDGNDFLNGGGKDDTLWGGDKNDTLFGDSTKTPVDAMGNDVLNGENGDDVLLGGGGSDALYGGDGNDVLFGEGDNFPEGTKAGDDWLDGGDGNDSLVGGGGNDNLYGGDDDDVLFGDSSDSAITTPNDGNDYIFGGAGNDMLAGAGGSDTLDGGTGDDKLSGGNGDDFLSGGDKSDFLQGDNGNDRLDGGDGNDSLLGGEGSDTLIGGSGDDILLGGAGDDVYCADGNDTIYDEDGASTIYMNGALQASDLSLKYFQDDDAYVVEDAWGSKVVVTSQTLAKSQIGFSDGKLQSVSSIFAQASAADFNITSSDISSTYFGGAGNDIITGGKGADTLYGGAGNDILLGGGNEDQLFGGDGDDTLNGGSGFNKLSGGAGNDLLISNSNDSLDGGEGDDTYQITVGSDHIALINDASGDNRLVISGVASADLTIFSWNGSVFLAAGKQGLVALGKDVDFSKLTIVLDSGESLTAQAVLDRDNGASGLVRSAEWSADTGVQWTTDTNSAHLIVASPDRAGWLQGSGASDVLVGSSLADRLEAGAGDDNLTAGNGADTLIGGVGDDQLSGGENDGVSDEYWFNLGDGADTINGTDSQALDNIRFGAGVTASDVTISNIGQGVHKYKIQYGENDSIVLNAGSETSIQSLIFADGSTVLLADLIAALPPSDGGQAEYKKPIYGTDNNDTLVGSDADDKLLGLGGDDVLTGGAGNDLLVGGTGKNTYVFGAQSGADVITPTTGESGTLVFAGDDLTQLQAWMDNGDLMIESASGGLVRISGYQQASKQASFDWTIQTADASSMSLADLLAQSNTSSEHMLEVRRQKFLNDQSVELLTLPLGYDNAYAGQFAWDSRKPASVVKQSLSVQDREALSVPEAWSASASEVSEVIHHHDPVYKEVSIKLGGSSDSYKFYPIEDAGSIPGAKFVGGGVVLPPGAYMYTYDTGIPRPDPAPGEKESGTDGTYHRNIQVQGYMVPVDDGATNFNFGNSQTITGWHDWDETVTRTVYTDSITQTQVTGTSGNDTITSEGLFRGSIDTGDGDDLVSLNSGPEWVKGMIGDSYAVGTISFDHGTGAWINAGNGNDSIQGSDGDDVIVGGAGNDWMDGGAGSDSYLISAHSGEVDRISDSGALDWARDTSISMFMDYGGALGKPNSDTVEFDSSVALGNLSYRWSGSEDNDHNRVLELLNNGEKFLEIDYDQATRLGLTTYQTAQWWYDNPDAYSYLGLTLDSVLSRKVSMVGVETFKFADGTTMSIQQLLAALPETTGIRGTESDERLNGTESADQINAGAGSDTIFGFAGNDTIDAGSGADKVFGGDGDDVLAGGTGNDTLTGGAGNDTYIFNVGDGLDSIIDADQNGTLQLGQGITLSGLIFSREAADLKITMQGSSDGVVLSGWYSDGNRISSISFADGSTLSGDQVEPLVVSIIGSANDDYLDGNAGNNQIMGGDGNDWLAGHAGNDTLIGGAGDNQYVFNRGDGTDTIVETNRTDTSTDVVRLTGDISSSQLWFAKDGDDLSVSVIGTDDKVVIKDWYLGTEHHVQKFVSTSGYYDVQLMDNQVEALVSAMAAFAPPTAGQTTLPSEYQSSLNPVIAANWH